MSNREKREKDLKAIATKVEGGAQDGLALPPPEEDRAITREEWYELKLKRRVAETRLAMAEQCAEKAPLLLAESINFLLLQVQRGEITRRTTDPEGGVIESSDGGREARLAATALLKHVSTVAGMMGTQQHQHVHMSPQLSEDQIRQYLEKKELDVEYRQGGAELIKEIALEEEVDD